MESETRTQSLPRQTSYIDSFASARWLAQSIPLIGSVGLHFENVITDKQLFDHLTSEQCISPATHTPLLITPEQLAELHSKKYAYSPWKCPLFVPRKTMPLSASFCGKSRPVAGEKSVFFQDKMFPTNLKDFMSQDTLFKTPSSSISYTGAQKNTKQEL